MEAGEEFVQHMVSEPEIGWCDVRFGCVAQDKGLELVGVKGLYGNGVVTPEDKTDEVEEPKVVELKSNVPPLVFHKVRGDAHFQRLYQESLQVKEAMAGKQTAYGPEYT